MLLYKNKKLIFDRTLKLLKFIYLKVKGLKIKNIRERKRQDDFIKTREYKMNYEFTR